MGIERDVQLLQKECVVTFISYCALLPIIEFNAKKTSQRPKAFHIIAGRYKQCITRSAVPVRSFFSGGIVEYRKKYAVVIIIITSPFSLMIPFSFLADREPPTEFQIENICFLPLYPFREMGGSAGMCLTGFKNMKSASFKHLMFVHLSVCSRQ